MSSVRPTLPAISDTERTPLVDALLEVVQWQSDRIEQLEDAIHTLKKTNAETQVQIQRHG